MASEVEDKSAILVLYENIETSLTELLDNKTIYSVEVFNSQTNFESTERPRFYPFVMIDISVNWNKIEVRTSDNSLRKIKQNYQKGRCTVNVHHIFEQLEDETQSFKLTEPVRHSVHRAINLLEEENYHSKLQRITTFIDSSHNRVFDLISVYECEIQEQAYVDSKKQTVTDPTLTLITDLDVDNETIRTGDGE